MLCFERHIYFKTILVSIEGHSSANKWVTLLKWIDLSLTTQVSETKHKD